jgi:hypothetical protein
MISQNARVPTIKYVIMIKVRQWGDWGYAIALAIKRKGEHSQEIGPPRSATVFFVACDIAKMSAEQAFRRCE